MLTKQMLRTEIEELKKNYSEEELKQFSIDIFNQLEQTSSFANAKYVLAYYSFPGEVFTHDFIEKHVRNKIIILPVVQRDVLILREFKGIESMRRSTYGILEPTGDEFTDFSKIDLAIVPGMSFDLNLNRLGRGKGYYDKLLSKLDTYLIGVCFSFQLREEITIEPHDLPMNCVISQNEIINKTVD